jgi:hypothetical protein
MKHAFEMSSGIMIYIPSFIKTGSGIQTLIGACKQTTHYDLISQRLLFRSKESMLKREVCTEETIYVRVSSSQWREKSKYKNS